MHQVGLTRFLAWFGGQSADCTGPRRKKKEPCPQSMLLHRGSGWAGLLGGSVYATQACHHNSRDSIDLDVVLDLEYQPLDLHPLATSWRASLEDKKFRSVHLKPTLRQVAPLWPPIGHVPAGFLSTMRKCRW